MLQEVIVALVIFGFPIIFGIYLWSGQMQIGEVEFKSAVDMQSGEISIGAFVDGVGVNGSFSHE